VYSQKDEEKYFLEYFGEFKGRILEIGAFHPEVFSNSRALILQGWEAVLVEPSSKCIKVIEEFYKNDDKVKVVEAAIGEYNGFMKFYDSAGACATGVKEHYNRWKNIQLDYKETMVKCITWDTFYKEYPGMYHILSIDAEGMDYSILKQINLEETGTKLICIEYGYKAKEINSYFIRNGFTKLLYQNGENVIVAKGEIIC
jgi:FkbM family methyltransferase